METLKRLTFVTRGEQKLYCFIEACNQIFPNVSRSTVRLWLRNSKIETLYPTLDERRVFKHANPQLKSSVFGLIRETDLKRLINEKVEKTHCQKLARRSPTCPQPKLVVYSDDGSSEDDDGAIATPKTTLSLNTSNAAATVTSSSPQKMEIVETATPTSSKQVCKVVAVSPAEFPTPPSSRGTTNDSGDESTPQSGKRCRTPYKLSKQEAGEIVNTEVNELCKFYTIELNPKRNGPPFAKQTLDKLVERIYCFLYFCIHHRNVPVVTLDIFNTDTLICEYVDYLSKVRKLMPNTITAHLSCIINVIKYNFREDWSALDSCKAVMSCRSYQRQLSRQAKMIAKRGKEGLCIKKASKRFYFNHILDTLRNLRAKIFETTGVAKARHLHDFVMLATYIRVNPGRSKEIRTLQVFVESGENPFDVSLFLDTNVIVFREDTTVSLIENDFKTVNSTGPINMDLSEDRELVYYLHQYNLARPSLLQAKSHAYFFLNYTGEPFRDSSSLCKHLGDLFDREVCIRVSTNVLRHSIVTYFKTLEDSEDLKIRESLARLMKHSLRYQQDTYDDTTAQQKTQPARELLRRKMAADIFGQADVVITDENEGAPPLGDEEMVLRPHVGDICALLDPAATADNICFFLAKVARYTSDQLEAHLIHLAPLDESETLFRLVPGKVWRERSAALLYPIDVLYNASQQAYELRTRPLDIYNMVNGH